MELLDQVEVDAPLALDAAELAEPEETAVTERVAVARLFGAPDVAARVAHGALQRRDAHRRRTPAAVEVVQRPAPAPRVAVRARGDGIDERLAQCLLGDLRARLGLRGAAFGEGSAPLRRATERALRADQLTARDVPSRRGEASAASSS
jgi:hypothetical protein